MSTLSQDIIKEFLKKTDLKSKQSVRNFVSKIKIKECPNATQNAAAQVAALIKNFSVAKKLKKEDRITLPNNLAEIIERYKGRTVEIEKKRIKKVFKKSFQNEIESEGYKNAKVYPDLYILENSLRKIILQTFVKDENWWEKRVPTKIKDYAKRIEEDEKRYKWRYKGGENPLYYVTLEHLLKIIMANWKEFKYIRDQEKLKVWVEELIPIRNLIAHNKRIHKTDGKQVQLNVDKILRLIKP
jgi:hypothetical protein